MNWLKLYSDRTYEQAMRKARKVQDEERKLKALGGCGNYDKVDIRLTFEINNRKLYSVFVVPITNTDDIPTPFEQWWEYGDAESVMNTDDIPTVEVKR